MNNESNTGLKESEIRPKHLMKGQAECFAADIRRLLKQKNEFVYVPCPACGLELGDKAFEKYEMTYVVCQNCETMYVNPRPTPTLLEMYYTTSENYAYWNKYIFPASEDARRIKIFRPRAQRLVEICRQYNANTEVLLEVGAGFGTFCEEIQSFGLFRRVIALESTPDLAETCRNKGLEVIEQTIEKAYLEHSKVNVVASFETIEHLYSPKKFMTRCAKLIEPGGLVIITCPNIKGFDLVVLGANSDTVDVEHLNYFNPSSITLLVNECGFEVLEVSTPGKLDAELVRNKIIQGEFDISSQPFLKQLLIEQWEKLGNTFQQFLSDSLLSSHLWIVARKK